MKKLAILGSGDLGQQIAHFAITDGHYKKVVFFDDFNNNKTIRGYDIVGKSKDIKQEFDDACFDELIIGIGYKYISKRAELFNRFENEIPFGTIIHSSCWLDSSTTVAQGTVVYPNCCLDANVVIKENCIVNVSSTIAHDTIIGRHCFLSPNVAIAGFVNVSNRCIVGINATIIDNITISSDIQLGGATVVTKDLFNKGLYVGNPARFIR